MCFSGRVHHAIGNYRQAVQYLQQGLQIAEQLSRKEDEAKIRHRLGLALWGHADLEGIGFSCFLFISYSKNKNNLFYAVV